MFKLKEGLQVYDTAPFTFNGVFPPIQIAEFVLFIDKAGPGETTMFIKVVSAQPTESIPINVYVVEAFGVAVTEFPDEDDKLAEGLHE